MQALRTSAFDYEQFKDRNPDRLEEPVSGLSVMKISETGRTAALQVSFGCLRIQDAESLFYLNLLLTKTFKKLETLTTCYFFFKDDNDE
jgi:hypothetical protein